MSRDVVRMLACWAMLMALLGLTLGVAFLPIGHAKMWLGYAIACAKAGLILWFFMEMRREDGIVRLAMTAGFLWMSFLLILSAADYLTRGWF